MTFCPRDLLQGSPFGSLSCLPTAEFWGVTTHSSSGPHLVTIGSGHKHRHRGGSLGPPPLTSWRALSLPPTRKLSFQPAPPSLEEGVTKSAFPSASQTSGLVPQPPAPTMEPA